MEITYTDKYSSVVINTSYFCTFPMISCNKKPAIKIFVGFLLYRWILAFMTDFRYQWSYRLAICVPNHKTDDFLCQRHVQ